MTRHQTRTHLRHISRLIDNDTDKTAKNQLQRTFTILCKQFNNLNKL